MEARGHAPHTPEVGPRRRRWQRRGDGWVQFLRRCRLEAAAADASQPAAGKKKSLAEIEAELARLGSEGDGLETEALAMHADEEPEKVLEVRDDEIEAAGASDAGEFLLAMQAKSPQACMRVYTE